MRQIVLDTETTGLDPVSGHRIVEIGCVEMMGHVRTGSHFHTYLNPERDSHEDALKVHGISNEFLKDKPRFAELAHGMSVSAVNSDAITPTKTPDAIYQLKLMGGVIPGLGVGALRFALALPEARSRRRIDHSGTLS